jgi:RNA polymerase sigma factor (sigma-70 family)
MATAVVCRMMATKILDLNNFIGGMVAKLIRSYEINDFLLEGRGSDYREDMIQTAWLAVLNARAKHPTKCNIPAYLKVVIVNALIKSEQSGRQRRMNTQNTIDEPLPPTIIAPESFANMEAKQDVERLVAKASLSDSELLVIELHYGFGRGEDIGECTIARTAQLAGRSETWVRARLTAANIKLQVAAE